MSTTRRLAAVMFLDMVGYSALMSQSESSAMACVRDLEAILRAEVAAAGGRLVKLMGDGSISEFPTGGAAVACAQRIQAAVAARKAGDTDCPFDVRIGLHLGEVTDEGGDLFGDAVNIAARVQPLADPGGIAMSGTVYAQVKNQGGLTGAFLPPAKLKNIPDRLSIFAVPPAGVSLSAWKLRRRGLPAAAWAAALLLALAGSWLGFRRVLRPSTPTLTLFYVHSPEETPEWRKRSKEFDERMTFRGSMIPGFRWQDRDYVLTKKGLGAVEDLDLTGPGSKTKACMILRDIGIDFAIYAYIGTGSEKALKVDYALIDSQKTDIVASDSVEGADTEELAKGITAKLTAWVKAGRPTE